MIRKPCAQPGCPELTTHARCDQHSRSHDAARGRRQARGYGRIYDAARRSYQQRMDAGETFDCWRCRELGKPHAVDPDEWHLGHDNEDRTEIRGPQCPDSNLRDAAYHHTHTPGV